MTNQKDTGSRCALPIPLRVRSRLAVALLCLQALWALSRVWPQGRPFAVMLGSFLAVVAASAAALQSGWIAWPGWIGGAVVAGRSFSLAALMVVFWGGWIYRALRVTTRNAGLWNARLQACLCTEVVCLTLEALAQRGAVGGGGADRKATGLHAGLLLVVEDGERWRGVCFAGKERDAGSGVAGASSKVGSKQEGGHGMKALFSFMLTCVEWAAYFRPC